MCKKRGGRRDGEREGEDREEEAVTSKISKIIESKSRWFEQMDRGESNNKR